MNDNNKAPHVPIFNNLLSGQPIRSTELPSNVPLLRANPARDGQQKEQLDTIPHFGDRMPNGKFMHGGVLGPNSVRFH
jgi:hypothetical protein